MHGEYCQQVRLASIMTCCLSNRNMKTGICLNTDYKNEWWWHFSRSFIGLSARWQTVWITYNCSEEYSKSHDEFLFIQDFGRISLQKIIFALDLRKIYTERFFKYSNPHQEDNIMHAILNLYNNFTTPDLIHSQYNKTVLSLTILQSQSIFFNTQFSKSVLWSRTLTAKL